MDIFPTLIEEYDLTSHPDLDTWKKHIRDSGKTNPHSLAVNGVSSHGGWDPLRDEIAHPMLFAFQQCLDDYSDKSGYFPSMLSGSWYNILPPGGFTHRHRHEGSPLSGAFYVQLPEGDVGNLYMISPLTPYKMCEMHLLQTQYTQYEFDVPIKENHLYIFPSWLEHGSRLNNTQGDRITVSFNSVPFPMEYMDKERLAKTKSKYHGKYGDESFEERQDHPIP